MPATSILHMHFTQTELENIRERERERVLERERLGDDIGDALEELKVLDPDGWEPWYDAPENIPEDATWEQILPLVRARIREMEERP